MHNIHAYTRMHVCLIYLSQYVGYAFKVCCHMCICILHLLDSIMHLSPLAVVSDSVPQSALSCQGRPSDQVLSTCAQSLLQSVHELKSELHRSRREHQNKMTELQVELILMKKSIRAAVTGIMNSAQICSGE